MVRDYYEVLGVPRNADAEQIQQAFRTLARRHHPDVNGDPAAEERFKQINEAYQVLSDPKTRARYDRFGPDFRQVPENAGDHAAGPSAARSHGFRRRGKPHIGDLQNFEEVFGGMIAAQGRNRIAGVDQAIELELSVEEAYRGGHRKGTLGGLDERRDYEVTIPAGVEEGQRIRLAGQGARGYGAGRRGDLYLVVRIAPHPRFRLSGRDIAVGLPVSPWEAALGATVPVETPSGSTKVAVPPGSSTGRTLKLRGEGMPNPKGMPGDLYAEVRIMVPPSPSKRERELFEQLAGLSSFNPRKRI